MDESYGFAPRYVAGGRLERGIENPARINDEDLIQCGASPAPLAPELAKEVRRVFMRTLLRFVEKHSAPMGAKSGAVNLVQRLGSARAG